MKVYLYLLVIFLLNFVALMKIEKINEISISEEKNIIEIEENYVITQISWTKTKDYILNYVLGVFEASNDSSFKNAIPIAIIKEQGKFNEVNFIDLNILNT